MKEKNSFLPKKIEISGTYQMWETKIWRFKMFKRIINLFSGILSSILRVFESRNPAVLIEAEKNNLHQQITRFNEGLSQQAGVVYNLAGKAQKTGEIIKETEQRISVLIEAGDRKNAAKMALKLSQLEKDLVELQTRCRCAEEAYQTLEKSRDQAVNEAKRRLANLENMVSQTEILNAQNELAQIAGNITRSIGSTQNSLDYTEEIVSRGLESSLGRSHVLACQLNRLQEDYSLAEAEKDILERRALAEYLASRGLEPDEIEKTGSKIALVKPGSKFAA